MAFYVSVFSWLPVTARPSRSVDSELAHRDALADMLPAWISLLIGRILHLISQLEESAKQGDRWRHSFRTLLSILADVLFAQMDHPTYKAAVSKLASFLVHNIVAQAKEDVCYLCDAAVYARPDLGMQQLFLPLYGKVVKSGDGSSKFRNSTTAQLEWFLHLLAACAQRAGSELLAYKQQLLTLFRLGYGHESLSVVKGAVKIQQQAIAALSRTYPSDYRSLPPQTWDTIDKGEAQPWKHYTPINSRDTLVMSWHIPREAELAFGHELANAILEPSCATLEAFNKEPAQLTSVGRVNLKKALHALLSVLRGASRLLCDPQAESEPSEEARLPSGFSNIFSRIIAD